MPNKSNKTHQGTDGRPAIRYDVYCPKCGYNLRTLTSDRCPECGESVELFHATESALPWTHRKSVGWIRAYWQTVFLVIFRQRRFCSEISRPVSYRDSQIFRYVSVLLAYMPVQFMTIMLLTTAGAQPFEIPLFNEAMQAVWPVVVLHVSFLLFLVALTGLPSYFFHPRDMPVELQNRTIAMSYYSSCAPLALTFVPIGFALISLAIRRVQEDYGNGVLMFATGMFALQTVMWFSDSVRLARCLMPLHKRRRWCMGLSLLPAVVLLGVLSVTGPLMISCYLTLIYASLQY